ncbi:unnamed protein product [Protopolystoma xenopodis]|uniref:Uncharacterized protein n=1 Tax=Protopolystoma xenopodis TaxID=117903 RepID=A0A448WDI7_9PLAT|nr:unnamed protein product [Protopolystoma xenopodis]
MHEQHFGHQGGYHDNVEPVEKYIRMPSSYEISLAVDYKPEKALQFVLSYLKLRGPFIQWRMREDSKVESSRHQTDKSEALPSPHVQLMRPSQPLLVTISAPQPQQTLFSSAAHLSR